jgi:hypothetical protein
MEMKLEVLVVRVADLHGATQLNTSLRWRVDTKFELAASERPQ